MFNPKWLAAIFTLSLVCFTATGQKPASTPRPEAPTMGSISGRVFSDTGQPLANATVFFRAATGQALARSTTTDSEGNFQLNNLDAALYNISATLSTYANPARDPDAPQILYRIGDTVRLDLVKGGVITGTVVNSAGDPVIGVRVRSILVRDASGKPTNGQILSVGEKTTDDRGIYRIYGLMPGGYLVQTGVGGSPFGTGPYDLDAPTFAPSSNRDTATEVTVRSGEESTADIRYRGEQGHVVSGTVKFRGTTGASITLTLVGDGFLPTGSAYQQPGARGFAMNGVGDGEYDIAAQEVVSSLNQMSPDLAMSERKRIIVKGADVTGLELVTNPLATLNGRVVLEPSKLTDCQNKRQPSFSETLVALTRNQKEDNKKEQSMYLRLFASNAFPDKDGAFSLRNLRPGQYSFATRFFARYWYVQSMTMGPTSATKPAAGLAKTDAIRNWTTIRGGETIGGLTITLAEGAASIKGQIAVPEGTQLPSNLRVYLVPSERDKAEDALRYFVAEVAADGSFSITNLPPGQYFTAATLASEKDPLTIEKLRLPDAADARSSIRRSAEAGKVSLELKPCQNVNDYRLTFKP